MRVPAASERPQKHVVRRAGYETASKLMVLACLWVGMHLGGYNHSWYVRQQVC